MKSLARNLAADLASHIEQRLDVPLESLALEAWFDPTFGIERAPDSDLIDAWTDQVKGYVLRNTGSARPRFNGSISGLDDRPGITFEGAQYLFADIALASLIDDSQPYTLYTVRRADTGITSGDAVVCWMSAAGQYVFHGNAGASFSNYVWRQDGGGNTNTAGVAPTGLVKSVTSEVYSGAAYNSWENGVASHVAVANTRAPASCVRFAIGARLFTNGTADRIWNGDLGDLLIFSAAHDTDTRLSIEDYLTARYERAAV